MKRRFIVVGAVASLLGVTLVVVSVIVRRPRLTAELRGADLAQEFGCFGCHGPGGTGGVPNPGSEEEEVPSWDGGTVMMYVENEQEIREWILYGHPKRLEQRHTHAVSDQGHAHDTPSARDSLPSSLPLRMPAFEPVISESQLEDLVAYYKAVAVFDPMPPDVRVGYKVASRLGCFGCHGPGGRVGSKNPRSFKGYIPPWRGSDFADLVETDEELRQWILEGRIDRLESNPVARYFTRRQVIQMPAYKDLLSDDELAALVAYIEWLQ